MDVNNVNATNVMSSNTTSDVSSLAAFLGRAAYEAHLIRPLLPTYLHLIASAVFPIWIASHASLVRPSSSAKPLIKRGDSEGDDDDDTEEISQKIENLSPSDAILFPVLAAIVLTGLYFILKNIKEARQKIMTFDSALTTQPLPLEQILTALHPAWLNYAMNLYFSQMGLFFSYRFLADAFALIRDAIFPRCYTWRGALWNLHTANGRCYIRGSGSKEEKVKHTSPLPGALRIIPLPGFLKQIIWRFREDISKKATITLHLQGLITLRATPTWLDVGAVIIAAILTYIHTFVAKPWQLTNFFGLSFCYGSLQLTSPSTAWTGTLLLSGLFFYDIYMVFFTPMMVHVATNLDVPIKMLFPRPDGCVYPIGAEGGSSEMEEYQKCLDKKRAMAMLGLGDIVVPGLIMAFALRWDLWLHYLKLQMQSSEPVSSSADKTNEGDATFVKEPYRPATGGWGERFWTSPSLRPAGLKAKGFKKTYFHATVAGYVLGMCTTVGVMQVAKHAQPALLYLVPGVLGALWGTALVKGEVKLLWNYVEEGEEDERSKKEKEKKEKEEKDEQKKDNDKKALQDGSSTSDESNALVKADSNKPSKAKKAGDAMDDDESDEDTVFKPEARKEIKHARQHAVYLAIKLPKTPSSAPRTEKKDNKNASSAAPALEDKEPAAPSPGGKGKTAVAADSTDSDDAEAEGLVQCSRGGVHVDDDEDDVDDEGVGEADDDIINVKIKTQKRGGMSGRLLRSSGAAENLGVLDEDGKRMAKRRRKV